MVVLFRTGLISHVHNTTSSFHGMIVLSKIRRCLISREIVAAATFCLLEFLPMPFRLHNASQAVHLFISDSASFVSTLMTY